MAEVPKLPIILQEEPASRDWFLDLYIFVRTERHLEMVNRQDASKLTALKSSSEGVGTPRPLRFRVYVEICVRQRPLRPKAHKVAGLADRWQDIEGRRAPQNEVLTALLRGGEVLNGLSPRASGPLSRSLLRVNNGPQIRFTL